MLKKMLVLTALLMAGLLVIGCASPGPIVALGDAGDFADEDFWFNPEFNMAEVTDIGNVWQLDLSNRAPSSWSDGDRWSMNPVARVAAATPNPAGGYDFTFNSFNQRIIFVLDSSQIWSIYNANTIEVVIDGEAPPHDNRFRYHIGNSELGSNWNATNSPSEGPFDTILRANLSVDRVGRGADLQDTIRNFMIQSRGGVNADDFTPVTVTIHSITFRIIN